MTPDHDTSPTPDEAAPIGPHTIRRFTLSNGMRLIVQENHASPSVVMGGHLWAGSVDDPVERVGLADFTASAMTYGTGTRSFQEINEITESVGASVFFGAGRHLVGWGGKSLTEDFGLLVEVLSDVLLNPVFPEKEVEKLRGQIITGLKELEDDTRGLAGREFRQMLYGAEHPYGRPDEGTLESVPTITRDDLIDFYHTHYRPDGAVMVVVGDVAADCVYETLEKRLGSWRPAADDAPSGIPAVEPLTEQRRAVRTMTNKTQVDIVLGTLGLARKDDEFYAARLANVILGQLGLMGRLGQKVRDVQGLAYYAYSTLNAGLGRGPWSVRAGVSPENVDQAIDSVVAEIARLRDEPVSNEEIEDGQDYLTGILPLHLETNEGIADTLLSMEVFDLGDDYIMRYPSLIRSVTRQQMQAAAQKYLDPHRYALAIVGPYES